MRILKVRQPRFALFDSDSRTLESEYQLAEVAASPPASLRNLARLSGLNLRAMLTAAEAGDRAEQLTLEKAANEQLAREFAAWQQSSATIQFRTDDTMLSILVPTEQSGYSSIAERSDGFRIFAALRAFVATRDFGSKPILLIDEAETHLHYDAQSDLVRVLGRQDTARQIFYTTHSAGCLPEDLGTGIRVVEPHVDVSRVRNQFWTDGPGVSPLLLAMGASAFAFTPARRALLTEGAADLIALPSMLREAMCVSDLGFQVAPGLAEVSTQRVNELTLEAARVAFVVDGDAAGANIRKKLADGGIPLDRIRVLGGTRSGLVLEDLMDPETYASAVNTVLAHHNDASTELLAGDLPEKNRPAFLEKWCAANKVESPPSKRAVANEVVAMRRDRALLSSTGVAVLQELHEQLTHDLDLN